MNYNRINNIVGWIVCMIASTVYILTAEAGGSLWDCGDFVSSAYKLQIPHPPGAPLFVMIGRLFIILFGNNPMTAVKAVNVMSALVSGLTILFLFGPSRILLKRYQILKKYLLILILLSKELASINEVRNLIIKILKTF